MDDVLQYHGKVVTNGRNADEVGVLRDTNLTLSRLVRKRCSSRTYAGFV